MKNRVKNKIIKNTLKFIGILSNCKYDPKADYYEVYYDNNTKEFNCINDDWDDDFDDTFGFYDGWDEDEDNEPRKPNIKFKDNNSINKLKNKDIHTKVHVKKNTRLFMSKILKLKDIYLIMVL